MSKQTEILKELIHIIRIKAREIHLELNTTYSDNLIKIGYLRWKELDNLKFVINEVGSTLDMIDSPYELSFINEESEYLLGDLDLMANALKRAMRDYNQKEVKEIENAEWFQSIINKEGHKIFYNKVSHRFNKLKLEHPDDFVLFTNNLRNSMRYSTKLKWLSNTGDLGYIFNKLGELGYFEFPKSKTRTKIKDVGLVADILLNTFEIKNAKRNTLKEFLGDGEIKKDEKFKRFENGYLKALKEDSEHIFNLVHRSNLKT